MAMSRREVTTTSDIRIEHAKMKWDPKTLEIRTKSVEKTLEPLVHQVSCLSFDFAGNLLKSFTKDILS